jgi:hypothetical protein
MKVPVYLGSASAETIARAEAISIGVAVTARRERVWRTPVSETVRGIIDGRAVAFAVGVIL